MKLPTPKLIAKRAIKSVASCLKAGGAFPALSANAVNILAYHRVAADIEKAEREAYYGLVVSSATFRRHCEILARSFNVVPLAESLAFVNGERHSRKPLAVITFDDGYRDFYEEAFPVLRELGLPATVFLPTDCIGRDEVLAHDRLYWLVKQCFDRSVPIGATFADAGLDASEAGRLASIGDRLRLTEALVFLESGKRESVIASLEAVLGDFDAYPLAYGLLNWEQVREMAASGIDFGGHTANHVVLPLEHGAAIESEIFSSKTELEAQLGRDVVSFAYPNGEYDARIRGIVERAGFRIAVTTEVKINRRGADPLSLGRISLCEESTRGISGRYSGRVAALRLHA